MEEAGDKFAKHFKDYAVKCVPLGLIQTRGDNCAKLLKDVMSWNYKLNDGSNDNIYGLKFELITTSFPSPDNKCRAYLRILNSPPNWW